MMLSENCRLWDCAKKMQCVLCIKYEFLQAQDAVNSNLFKDHPAHGDHTLGTSISHLQKEYTSQVGRRRKIRSEALKK